MEDINDNIKNTYVIRRRLAELQPAYGGNHYEYWIGEKFRVNLYPKDIQDLGGEPVKSLVSYPTLTVNVYDCKRDSDRLLQATYIYLERDSRFCNYQPIQHKQWGKADGRDMPLQNVCELIKYLHIIAKLTAFL